MKLVKFLNCDGPLVDAGALQVSLEDRRVRVVSGRDGGHVAKSWRLVGAPPVDGCYWLLADDNTPIGPVREVLIATNGDATDGGAKIPDGVADVHTDGVDLRSKKGRTLQRACEEYGRTFKTAAKNAALLMDAERLRAGREEKERAERKRVVDAVENGAEPARKTRARGEKGAVTANGSSDR